MINTNLPSLQISIGFVVRRRDTITIIIATSVRRHQRLLITTMLPRGVPGSTYTTEEAVSARVVVLPVTMLLSISKQEYMMTTTRIQQQQRRRQRYNDDDDDKDDEDDVMRIHKQLFYDDKRRVYDGNDKDAV